jgi:hypothetical protein
LGFPASIKTRKITANEKASELISTVGIDEVATEMVKCSMEESSSEDEMEVIMDSDEKEEEVKVMAPGTVQIGEGGASSWGLDSPDVQPKAVKKQKDLAVKPKKVQGLSHYLPQIQFD